MKLLDETTTVKVSGGKFQPRNDGKGFGKTFGKVSKGLFGRG